jgi:hypothetical protein
MSHASAQSSGPSATAVCAAMNGGRLIRRCVCRSRKQRNKHIQRALVEAAKLAPRHSHELAMIYDGEGQKGNSHRAAPCGSPEDGRVSACRRSTTERLRTCGRPHDSGSIDTAEINRMNKMRRLPDPAVRRLSEEIALPRLSTNCFGTGREHKLNLR